MAATDLDITSSCSDVQRKEAVLSAFLLFLRRKGFSRTFRRHFLKSQKWVLQPPLAARKVGKERISGFFNLEMSGEGTD